MDYRELYDIALKQEQKHFIQLLAGRERHREQVTFWGEQRRKAAALWTEQRRQAEEPAVTLFYFLALVLWIEQRRQAEKPEPEPQAAEPGPEPKLNEGVDCIRTYPDLSQHCLAQRLDLSLRLWYILRKHNSDTLGDGWLTERQVFDLSIGNKRQTRAWLRRGLNVFWHRHGDKYRLTGLGAVVETLVVKLPKACVDVPREHLESLGQFRAALFASWCVHGGDDGITISQAALSKLFGRTPRTLRRWAAMTDLAVIHNLAVAPIPKSKDDLLERYANGMTRYPSGTAAAMGWTDDDKQQKSRPNPVWFDRYGDDLLLTWKMANTYAMAWTPGPRTTLQRRASRRAPAIRGEGANVFRMYFDKDALGNAVAKAIQRKQGPVYLETGKKHQKTGDVLWSKQA